MFRRIILAVLGAAALSAAAQAAVPCATPGKAGCHKPAATVAARSGPSASKKARAAVHGKSRQAEPHKRTYAKAEALLARTLANRERTLGEEHLLTLTTANSLAMVYKAQGRYKEAEWLYHRSLEASARTLGNEHPLTRAAIIGLASAYEAEGRHAEAKLLCWRTGLLRSPLDGKSKVKEAERPLALDPWAANVGS